MAHDLANIESALDLIIQADDRRARLHMSAAELRARLDALGYAIASQSQIIALESGRESETLRLRHFLERNAIYGSAFCAPATRVDQSLIRLSLHAGLGRAELDRIVEVCAEARSQVAFADWASTRRSRNELASAGG
jgi:CAI-1 autoinducer synthase